ncbi:MAG: tryptophan 2,3-dioxygenase family protein [Myxococcota bacterium]|nr:tryptophan 2,3-dioxygenase family protein [Myxococcota bacterium]
MSRKPTTYWDYIRVESLLSLQRGVDDDESRLSNDEVMFLVVHQVDELWFKLALRELVTVRDLFARPSVPEASLAPATRGLRRMELLFRLAADQFALMETMTTRDYLAFRDKLSPASGFQSAQMREIEILLGLPDEDRIPLGHERSYLDALREPDGSESAAYRRVALRLVDRPTLREAIDAWLYRTPIEGSRPDDPDDEARVRAFVEAYCAAQAAEVDAARRTALAHAPGDADRERLAARFADEIAQARAFLLALDRPEPERRRRARIRAAAVFIESYRELPLLAWPREVLDALIALEQAFVLFRQRHARMVERVIGRRTGTGGSSGVDYLDTTALRYRIFRDLWAARTLLVRAAALPPLRQADAYALPVET